MEGAGDDFVSGFHAAGNFDIGGAGDAGGDGDEVDAQFAFFVAQNEDSLNLLLRGIGGRVWLCSRRIRSAHGERLNGNGDNVIFPGSLNLGGGREARAESFCRRVNGDDDLEVLGFLLTAGGLAGGDTGRPQQGLIADLGDMALEDFSREARRR